MEGFFDREGKLREVITVDSARKLYFSLTGGHIGYDTLVEYVTYIYRHLGKFYYFDADGAICEGIRQKKFIYFVKTRHEQLKTSDPAIIFGDEHL